MTLNVIFLSNKFFSMVKDIKKVDSEKEMQ